MLTLWNAKQSSMLGVDIGSSAVRVLELGKKGESYTVVSYASEPIPNGVVNSKSIKEPEVIIEKLSQAIKKAKIKNKKAIIAVPDSSVITKIIQIESGLSDDESEELIHLEADKYIPYPIDEVSIDYEFLGDSAGGATLQDILVVASRTENVNARVDLMRDSGLDVQIVDVESYAIERTCQLFKSQLPDQGENSTIAVFDIGEIYTQLTVLHSMKTIFSREDTFGGKQLTEEIVKRYDISVTEAKKAKKTGALPDDYVNDVLEPFKELISLQLRRALQFFYSTSQHTSIDQIFLAGGSSLLPGLSEKVSSVLDVPTKLVDPIENMAIGKGIDLQLISHDSSALMIACGLAMRKFEQ